MLKMARHKSLREDHLKHLKRFKELVEIWKDKENIPTGSQEQVC